MRLFLETLAGIAGGVASWFIVGLAAGQILTTVQGDREGAAAMGGFFVIGPIGGIAGYAIAFWLARRALERGTPGSGLLPMALSLLLVVGLGWVAVAVLSAVFRPKAWVDLEPGQRGGLEVRLRVPEKLLAGRPWSSVVGVQFKRMEEAGDDVAPVALTESRGSGTVTLSGRVDVARRPREQYFVVRDGRKSFDVYAQIPPDMHSAGGWQDEISLGSDPQVPMGDRVSISCRYVPPRR